MSAASLHVCLADFGEAKIYATPEDSYTFRNRGTEFMKSPEMVCCIEFYYACVWWYAMGCLHVYVCVCLAHFGGVYVCVCTCVLLISARQRSTAHRRTPTCSISVFVCADCVCERYEHVLFTLLPSHALFFPQLTVAYASKKNRDTYGMHIPHTPYTTDVLALGCLFYELTHAHACTPAQVLRQLLTHSSQIDARRTAPAAPPMSGRSAVSSTSCSLASTCSTMTTGCGFICALPRQAR